MRYRNLLALLIVALTLLGLVVAVPADARLPATVLTTAPEPLPDLAWSTPLPVGPSNPHWILWPKIVAERDASLSIVDQWGYLDTVYYQHSIAASGYLSWTAQAAGGYPQYPDSAGNIQAVATDDGKLHMLWYTAYGWPYYSLNYRQRAVGGQLLPIVEVPGSQSERMKIDALAAQNNTAYILAGHSGTSLYLYALTNGEWSWQVQLPLTSTSQPNPSWLPALAIVQGAPHVLWGDYRLGRYVLADAYPASGARDNIWVTHFFTETNSQGQPMNNDQQYRVAALGLREGGMAAAFECRVSDAGKDMCYREWNPGKYGTTMGGWMTTTIQFNSPAPDNVAPALCQDSYGQRYLFWMYDWSSAQNPRAEDEVAAQMTADARNTAVAREQTRVAGQGGPVATRFAEEAATQAAAVPTANATATVIAGQGRRRGLMVVYSYSSDGQHWTAPQYVWGGDHFREKHPTCAVAPAPQQYQPPAGSGQPVVEWLHTAWSDHITSTLGDDGRGPLMQLYYQHRPRPPLYPQRMATATPLMP